MSATFVGTKLESMYRREVYWLAFQIGRKADALFARFPQADINDFLCADLEGLDLIYSLLADAAKLWELLSPGQKPLGPARSQELRRLLASSNTTELTNKKVRNTIEHFGEYLDDTNRAHSDITSSQRYFVAYNLVIGRWSPTKIADVPFQLYTTPQLSLPIYPVRVYVASERRMFNMNWSVDISALRKEALEIVKALQRQFPEERPECWMSACYVL